MIGEALISDGAFRAIMAIVGVLVVPLLGVIWKRIADVDKSVTHTRENYVQKADMHLYTQPIKDSIQSLGNELKEIWGNGAIGTLRKQVADLSDRISRIEAKHEREDA